MLLIGLAGCGKRAVQPPGNTTGALPPPAQAVQPVPKAVDTNAEQWAAKTGVIVVEQTLTPASMRIVLFNAKDVDLRDVWVTYGLFSAVGKKVDSHTFKLDELSAKTEMPISAVFNGKTKATIAKLESISCGTLEGPSQPPAQPARLLTIAPADAGTVKQYGLVFDEYARGTRPDGMQYGLCALRNTANQPIKTIDFAYQITTPQGVPVDYGTWSYHLDGKPIGTIKLDYGQKTEKVQVTISKVAVTMEKKPSREGTDG